MKFKFGIIVRNIKIFNKKKNLIEKKPRTYTKNIEQKINSVFKSERLNKNELVILKKDKAVLV